MRSKWNDYKVMVKLNPYTLTISKASVSQAASKFMSRKDTLNTFSSPSRANLMLL